MTAFGRRAAVAIATLQIFSPAVMPLHAAVSDSSAPAAASARPHNAVVAEAQALMAELGLWDGATDGEASAAFGQAVRQARGRFGLAPEALEPVDSALLSALRSHAEARRITRQLDAARSNEEAAARAAIAATPPLADALRPPSQDQRAPEPAITTCRAAPTTACLLDAAQHAARTVPDAELRTWGLTRIARARVADTGALESAWPALRLLDDPRGVFTALSDIAEDAARDGRIDLLRSALAHLQGLPAAAARATATAALRLAEHGGEAALSLAEQAEAMVPNLSTPADRDAVLTALARMAHGHGRTEDARALMARTRGAPDVLAPAWALVGGAEAVKTLLQALPAESDPAARRAVVMELAAAQAKTGAIADALTTAEAVAEPRYRAVVLADLGVLTEQPALLEQAEATARDISLPFARSYALAHTAEGWLALGRPARAFDLVALIDTDTLAVDVLNRVARHPAAEHATATRAGQSAQERRDAMIDRVARVRLAAERAETLAHDAPDAAALAARAAVDEAVSIRDRWNATRALLLAADAMRALRAAGVDVAPLNADVEEGANR